MRFVSRCLMAVSFVLVCLGSAHAAQSVTIGETAVLSAGDSGNADLLIAQSAKLAQTATIESLSFYVTAASGQLVLGIYDATGPNGGPGALKASTASFATTTGWNTAHVVTPVSLAAGAYWLAYLPSSNTLSFVKTNASGNCAYYSYNFGAMPSKFSTSPASCVTTWSFYATLAVATTTAINGACGSSNGGSLTSAPTANLCSAGTPSTVSGSGPWSWTCAGAGGGTTATCSALKVASAQGVSGACGSSNGASLTSAPTANLCTAGTASTPSGTGPWYWNCAGTNGGATASCSASLKVASSASSGSSSSSDPSYPASGLLPSDRDASANWQKAGLQSVGGIPNRTTQCGSTITPSGGDDTSKIQTAVNNCASGDYVLLSTGTFTIGESNSVFINKSVTVRGSGACAGTAIGSPPYPSSAQSHCTLIQRTNGVNLGMKQGASGTPTAHFVLGSTDVYANLNVDTGTLLTADGAQGASTISVASTSGFSAGQFVLLDEASNMGWQSSWIWPGQTQWSPPDYRLSWAAQNPTCDTNADKACSGGSTPPSIPCYFGYAGSNPECDEYTKEIKLIASVGSGTITFDSPLTTAYRKSNSAHLVHIYGGPTGTTPFATYAGLENLTLQNADGSEVIIGACAYCWTKNIEVTIGSGGYSNGLIAVEGSFRDQIEGSLIWKGTWPYPGGAGYNLSIDKGASEILVENSISLLDDKVMVVRGAGAGSVIAYNYFDESILGGGSGETEVGANASHWIGSHHVLFEGNWSFQLSSDPVWGPSLFDTWIRNDVTGFRTPFYDYADGYNINDATSTPGSVGGPTGNNAALGVGLAGFSYWQSFIGNVIGTPGLMSAWTYHSTGAPQAIWSTGYFDSSAVDGEVWSTTPGASACTTPTSDPCPMIRLSNYDYVTNSIADSSNPTVPNSFYLSGKPTFFSVGSGYIWPWVNSQGSPKVQTGPTTSACTTNVKGPCSGLPAKARMDNGTPFTQP